MRNTWIACLLHQISHGALYIPLGVHPQNEIGTDLTHSRNSPRIFSMPKISYTDSTNHVALVNAQKYALRSQLEISEKATS